MYHYRSMAKTSYRGYLRADAVPLKKYFYVLCPLLSVRWIESYGCAAPIEFEKLLHLIDGQPLLLVAVRKLLAKKQNALETGPSQPVPVINAFIIGELNRLEDESTTKCKA